MRFQFVAAFLVGSCISISLATRGEAIKDFGNKKCERAVPLPPWASAYRGKCTYICKGWPLRVENEPDGIACGLVTINPRKRVCQAGHCVRADWVSGHPAATTTFMPSLFTKD